MTKVAEAKKKESIDKKQKVYDEIMNEY